jgi:hypothetical protein
MSTARGYTAATLLSNGRVLVAGGSNLTGALATSEVFDPSTGNWAPPIPMRFANGAPTMVTLSDGTALVAGGPNALQSAELFDPLVNGWFTMAPMKTLRMSNTLTLLNTGAVMAAGGDDINLEPLASVELFVDPPPQRRCADSQNEPCVCISAPLAGSCTCLPDVSSCEFYCAGLGPGGANCL